MRLSFRQAWTVVVAGTDSEHRLVGQLLRRPAKAETRAEVGSLHRVPVPGVVWNELAGGYVEPQHFIVFLTQWAVVLIAQPVAHREVWSDLPLILYVADIECLPHVEKSALAGERTY